MTGPGSDNCPGQEGLLLKVSLPSFLAAEFVWWKIFLASLFSRGYERLDELRVEDRN